VNALTSNGTPRLLAQAAVDRILYGGTSKSVARQIWRKYRIKVPVRKGGGYNPDLPFGN
jgi:hypothetical protein